MLTNDNTSEIENKKLLFFGYYGGKSHMVEEIASFVPPDTTHWIEAFAGSAVVTLNRDRGNAIEVINDFSFDIYNLLDLMSCPTTAKALMDSIYKMPYSKSIYNLARDARRERYFGLSRIERATLQFVSLTQSYSATQRGFANRDIRKDGKVIKPFTTKEYQKKLHKKLPLVAKRLEGVTVTNRDATEVIREYGDISTATIYADPPYRAELRNGCKVYNCEMDDRQQRRFLNSILYCKARLIVSGYRSEYNDLYDRYLYGKGWHLFRVKEVKKHCQLKEVKDTVSEYFWCNFEPPEGAIYLEKVY